MTKEQAVAKAQRFLGKSRDDDQDMFDLVEKLSDIFLSIDASAREEEMERLIEIAEGQIVSCEHPNGGSGGCFNCYGNSCVKDVVREIRAGGVDGRE